MKIQGGIELFSTKPQSYDRKLYRTLDKHIDSIQQDALLQYTNAVAEANGNNNTLSTSLEENKFINTIPRRNGGNKNSFGSSQSLSLSPPSFGSSRLSKSANFPLISPPLSHKGSTLSNGSNNENPDSNNKNDVKTSSSISIVDSNTSSNSKQQQQSSPLLSIPPGIASSLISSPFGPLDQAASRKAFGYLISVLNSTHPDHDFSSLQPSDFKREPSVTSVINNFNNLMFSAGMPLPPNLWQTLDDHIGLKECACYSHIPPDSLLNDMQPGTLWCYMWFFFNKRRKRVGYLHLSACRSRAFMSLAYGNNSGNSAMGDAIEEDYEDDEDYDKTYRGIDDEDEEMEQENDDSIRKMRRRRRIEERRNSINNRPVFYSDIYDDEEYDLANSSSEDGIVGDLELE